MMTEPPISRELLDILACPACKSEVVLTSDQGGLRCDACRLVYPIKDGIPVMLIDEAIRESSQDGSETPADA